MVRTPYGYYDIGESNVKEEFKMAEMDESLHILLDFMQTLTEMKSLIEKEVNISPGLQ